MTNRTVLILGASSDIGMDLMERYLANGAQVVGTYRNFRDLGRFAGISNLELTPLDFDKPESFSLLTDRLRSLGSFWDLVVFCNGTMEPIGPFLSVDPESWQNTIMSNAILPCRLLRHLYPFRRPSKLNDVAFFAGGGTNNPMTNYSAYCLSKIMLIKMCELLDDEISDLKCFILGPGYVRTKIHEETLRAGAEAGKNLGKTQKLLETQGTPYEDIFACLEWCVAQSRDTISGRNISVVHDDWRSGGVLLRQKLLDDPNAFKLRRHGN